MAAEMGCEEGEMMQGRNFSPEGIETRDLLVKLRSPPGVPEGGLVDCQDLSHRLIDWLYLPASLS